MVGIIMTSEMLLADKYLHIIHDRGKRGLPLERVYRNMRKPDLFLKAYAKIYANAGATTTGTDPEDTIQGMSLKRIDAIIKQLKDGTYRWKPSRRVHIPKSNGSLRPLSVPNWSDKLMQEVMRMILEAYYEPQFRDSSHGFRPNRGCHTALTTIKRTWAGTRWFIEGDIKGAFDNIDHNLLINLLSHNIHDNRFLKLVKAMLNAGYMEDWKYHQTYSGTPQGGILSPLLSNIVLHQLDTYVEEVLIPKYTRGDRRKFNPEYNAIQMKKRRAKQMGDEQLCRELSRQMRKLPTGDPFDEGYRRLKYLRYADDFLLGFIGSSEEARAIKEDLRRFLRTLKLNLSEEKTLITHAGTQAARFLGYDIIVAWNNSRMPSNPKDGVKQRSVNGTIRLYIPKDIPHRWKQRYMQDGKIRSIWAYRNMSDYEIVETFGAQLRGLVTYYALATNLSAGLRAVRWACMESTRKTLASKHNMRSPRKSYRRYHHHSTTSSEWSHLRVVIEHEGKKSLIAKCGETPLCTRRQTTINDVIAPYIIAGHRSELLTRLIQGECELCGRQDTLEAHHINSVENLRKRWQGRQGKPAWVQTMLIRRRKTIVVCHSCHVAITHGRYDGLRVQ